MTEGVSELDMNISSDGDCDFDEADTCQMIGVSSQAPARIRRHEPWLRLASIHVVEASDSKDESSQQSSDSDTRQASSIVL